jgi:hypothetical protein
VKKLEANINEKNQKTNRMKALTNNTPRIETNEPQEEKQGVKEQAHLRLDIEDDDQTHEQNGSEEVSN